MAEDLRIGIGTDTHRLERGLRLILGGVEVSSETGAVGHSDADALTHAVTDALLGALERRRQSEISITCDDYRRWRGLRGRKRRFDHRA